MELNNVDLSLAVQAKDLDESLIDLNGLHQNIQKIQKRD